jgi:hypothetical protein
MTTPDTDFTIYLPYKSEPPPCCCDVLVDFHLRVDALINYVGESLLLLDTAFKTDPPTGVILPKLPNYLGQAPKCPMINLNERQWNTYHNDIPQRLFHSSIVQLASHFETCLAELANEIYYANEELLFISERQLTTRKIFELGSIKRIRHHLKRKAVLELIGNRTYPSIVKAFQNTLHIGIHSSQSPATKAEIHHFIEVRNIVVHNEGQASQSYFARMSNYDPAPPRMLENVGDSLVIFRVKMYQQFSPRLYQVFAAKMYQVFSPKLYQRFAAEMYHPQGGVAPENPLSFREIQSAREEHHVKQERHNGHPRIAAAHSSRFEQPAD